MYVAEASWLSKSIAKSAGLFRETGIPLVSCPETFGGDTVLPLTSDRGA